MLPRKNRSIHDFFAPVSKEAQRAPPTQPDRQHSQPLSGSATRDASRTVTSPASTTPQSSTNVAVPSKRVVSNGEPVVLDSDSDGEEFIDLDALWEDSPKKSKIETQAPASRSDKKPQDGGLRRPPKKPRENKAFALFVQTARQSDELEQHIAQVKADLDKPLPEHLSSTELDVSEEMLANAVNHHDDPNKAKKLYLAMQRTNALHTDPVFHFFDQDAPLTPSRDPPFPISCLPEHEWTDRFTGGPSRDRAFLSGFAQQAFEFQHLPEELASWIIDQVAVTHSGILGLKYIKVLETHHDHLRNLLDEERLDSIFKKLGISMQCLDTREEIHPSYDDGIDAHRYIPASLQHVCSLLHAAAPRLRTQSRQHAIYILLLLCMDVSMQSSTTLLRIVQETIEALICHIFDNHELATVLNKVLSLLLRRITNPTLQHTLVQSMPTKSPLAAYFQRYLAISFLFYPTTFDCSLDDPRLPKLLCSHLDTSPSFRIARRTDYVALAARFELLDISIGPGPLAVPYQPLTSPSPSQDGFWCPGSLAPSPTEIKAFNQEVDALAQQIKRIGNKIIETQGLTDLTRLDAKGCIERLFYRLDYTVRFGGRKLKSIFKLEEEMGAQDPETERGRAFLRRWANPGSQRSTAENMEPSNLTPDAGSLGFAVE